MKKSLIIIFLILLVIETFGQSYKRKHFNTFPGFNEIISAYYGAHNKELYSSDQWITFEKRENGWYVVFRDYDTTKSSRKEKIWDSKRKKYTFPLNSEISETDRAKIAEKRRGLLDMAAYLWPVYGYPKAYDDVIEMLGTIDYEKLNAFELEGLARAYEKKVKVECLGQNIYEYKDEGIHAYESTFNPEVLDTAKINSAVGNAMKALDVYKFIAKKYPEYFSIIGSMQTKMSGSAISFYLDFRMLQQYEVAQQFLEAADFSEAMIEVAKNYLKSCPENAVLITYGDNDTYPLLYIQEKLNYRTDVRILNRNLLYLPRYIYYVTNLLAEKNRLDITLSIENYAFGTNDFILLDKKTNAAIIDIKEVFEGLNGNVMPKQMYFDKYDRVVLEYSQIMIDEKLNIEFEERYIRKDAIVLMDLLASNSKNRPFCFTGDDRKGIYGALRIYFENHGIVNVLNASRGAHFDENSTNIPALEDFLFNQCYYLKAEDCSKEEFGVSSTLYYINHFKLIEHYWKRGDTMRVLETLDHLYRVSSFEYNSYGYYHVKIAEILLEIQKETEALKHLKAYFKELTTELTQANKKDSELTPFEQLALRNGKNEVTENINQLIQFLKDKNIKGLESESEEILKRLNASD